ncbi:MAG: hypothetical protein K2X47_11150 [Bdellovibrionales bacterium]|nr:hypothetical protein [Bdellovibrionales bacterium]
MKWIQKRLGVWSVAAVVLFAPFARGSSDTVFVREATGVAVSANELQVTTELIRTSVSQVSGHQLSLDAKKSEITLQPKLLRLDETLMLTLQKLKGDQVERSDQIKVSDFDELDMVALRLTRAVLEDKPVRESERVDEVTRNEQQLVGRRKEAAKNWVVGFGPHTSRAMGTDASLFNFHLGYSWLVKPQSEIKLFWDNSSASGSPSASLSYVGLGYTHLLSVGDRSPFFGGEMGYGSASFSTLSSTTALPVSESAKGFVGGLGVGYRFFRTSSINLDVQFRGAMIFDSGSLGKPMVGGFRLSLYF